MEVGRRTTLIIKVCLSIGDSPVESIRFGNFKRLWVKKIKKNLNAKNRKFKFQKQNGLFVGLFQSGQYCGECLNGRSVENFDSKLTSGKQWPAGICRSPLDNLACSGAFALNYSPRRIGASLWSPTSVQTVWQLVWLMWPMCSGSGGLLLMALALG